MTMMFSHGSVSRRPQGIIFHTKYLHKRWGGPRLNMMLKFNPPTLVYSQNPVFGRRFCRYFVLFTCVMAFILWMVVYIMIFLRQQYANDGSDTDTYYWQSKANRIRHTLLDAKRVKHDIDALLPMARSTLPAQAFQTATRKMYADRIARVINKASEESRNLWRRMNNDGHRTTTNLGDGGGSRKMFYGPSVETARRIAISHCPDEPPGLLGYRGASQRDSTPTLFMEEVAGVHADVSLGGEWKPRNCVARFRLAVVVPYRDRMPHLISLLANLLPILKRQQLHFRIFVAEQHGRGVFNKGRVMNAAFWEASKLYDFDCVVFHDVDLMSLDDRNMYSCPEMPRHMSVAIDAMEFKLPYSTLVGGVLNFRADHFRLVNGYSNLYWGWGGEDDDIAQRIVHVGLRIYRPPGSTARYHTLSHPKRQSSSRQALHQLLNKTTLIYHVDGLGNVPYNLVLVNLRALYTHILVNVGTPYNVLASGER